MATAAQAETGTAEMIALADRGHYEGEQIRSCAQAGIIPMVPKPNTSPAQALGFWGKAMFVHEPPTDTYRCPAGQQLQKRFARVEGGKLLSVYFNQKACSACPSRPLCTAGKEKRIRRWEHEAVLVREQAYGQSSLEVTDNRPVALITSPSPVVNANHRRTRKWRASEYLVVRIIMVWFTARSSSFRVSNDHACVECPLQARRPP